MSSINSSDGINLLIDVPLTSYVLKIILYNDVDVIQKSKKFEDCIHIVIWELYFFYFN